VSGSAEVPGGIPARYKVEKELGRGGMGRVVAAFDTTIRRRVAIKIAPAPPPGDIEQQKAFQRFRREAQLAGGLRHENIVGIYDFGADAQSAWMVMEIVEGGSLRELLQRTEAFSLAETARIMVQLLDGLAFCHDQGIVHCDVKPANIMLTEPTTAGEVKLADFGIARNFGRGRDGGDDSGGNDPGADDGEATRVFSGSSPALAEAERIGTPAYMAPEQFTGGPLDQRTDVWAAGVVLYHLLTRENPFKGDADSIELKVMTVEPTPPSQLSVLATRAFDDLVRKALAKRPQDRFPDARSFAAALLEATRARRAGASSPPPKVTIPEPAPPPTSPGWVKYAAAGGGVAVLAGIAAFLLMPGTPPPAPTPALTLLVQPAPEPSRPAPVQRPEPAVTQPSPAPAPAPAPAVAPLAAPLPGPPVAPVPQILLVPAQPPSGPPSLSTPSTAQPPATQPQAAPPQPVLPPQATPEPPRPAPALVPAPIPAPPAAATPALIPAQPAAPSESEVQAALASATAPQRCALLDARREGSTVILTGFVHRAEVASLQQRLLSAGLTPRLEAEVFDAPFCDILAVLRPAMAAPGAPRVAARSTQIRAGERLTLEFETANWPTTVNLWFVMHDGQTLRLLGDQRMGAAERRMMNETSPDFPWLIAEPFGHEMVIMLASDGPPFPALRPLEETIDSLTGAMRDAIRRAQAEGRRLVARAIMVQTRP
jgi:serine/threonine protein kinase